MRSRRMVRSFSGESVDPEVLASLADDALRAPTAGNCRGISILLLEGPEEVASYLTATTDPHWRATSSRSEGFSRAAAVALVVADPDAYVERYRADDKAASGLGAGEDAWPVPYWIGDAGAVTMSLLLRCEQEGLAACFLGAFRGIEELRESTAIPETSLVYGAVLIGHSDGLDHRSASLDRSGPSRADRLHRGRFGGS